MVSLILVVIVSSNGLLPKRGNFIASFTGLNHSSWILSLKLRYVIYPCPNLDGLFFPRRWRAVKWSSPLSEPSRPSTTQWSRQTPSIHLNRSPTSGTAIFNTLKPLIARFMGPTWAHLGPTGPRWAPCWPHELCYLGPQWNVWYFADFRYIFWKENICVFIQISLKFVPKGAIVNKSALVQVMAWHLTWDKPLP